MKRIIIAVLLVLFYIGIAPAQQQRERGITSLDRMLKFSVPCNGTEDGPVYLDVIFPDVVHPQYVCHHHINADYAEVALIYGYNPNDKMFELLRAMRLNDYFEIEEYQRGMMDMWDRMRDCMSK